MGVGSEADFVGGTDLTRMQRMAAGLLVLASMIYAVSGFYESMRMSVGFIVETTEPAMVGAIACGHGAFPETTGLTDPQ
jgi:uncharacterized membrane-anchored protein YjiN (DUF445 family)